MAPKQHHLWQRHSAVMMLVVVCFCVTLMIAPVRSFSLAVALQTTYARLGNPAIATQREATSKQTETTESSSSSSNSNNKPAPPAPPVGKVMKQMAVLDGAEWISVRNRLLQQQQQQQPPQKDQLPPPSYARTVLGVYLAISGSVQGKRVVAMQVLTPPETAETTATTGKKVKDTVTLDQDSSVQLYKDSVAYIPENITEQDALWTLLQSLSIVHCVRPVLRNVGGSQEGEQFLHQGKVVVLGGSDLAVTSAAALRTLDCQVTVVSTEKPAGLPASIRHLTPSVGEENLAFCTALDQFDSLLDLLGDEQSDGPSGGSIILRSLAEKHGCHIYASARTESQKLMVDNGLLWGPAKSKEHVEKLQSRAIKATSAQFPSPVAFGATVQSLLEKGFVLKPPQQPPKADAVFVRGWSLKDFWEYTTWPREAAASVRFGFPWTDERLNDDEDEDDEGPMLSAPPLNPSDVRPDMFLTTEDEEVDNPYVFGVNSVRGLQKIVEDETTCLLFLSAPFCRTCRYLKPQYQRMARKYLDTASDLNQDLGFVFVKAEANGAAGKELGRALNIDAVPSFLFFKKGRRYGKSMSISRLPSKKLEMAIEYLQQDKPWNEDIFSDEGEESTNSNKSSLL